MKPSFVLAISLLMLSATGVQAQTLRQARPMPDAQVTASAEAPILHVTDDLMRRPEAQQALRDYHAARQAGTLERSGKRQASYQLGQVVQFRVLRNLGSTISTWTTLEFTLMAQSALANIWVETAELDNGNVGDDDVTALEEAMLNSTPEGSINPDAGIIANDNAVFGDPPNVDGDGRVDILLHDISEAPGVQGNVLGYVTSADLSASGSGNNADVLYLDTDPGVVGRPIESVLQTAAHEYQHLIHFGFDLDEETFVNEGLSEWAERLNGYTGRTVTYLDDEVERGISLMTWRRGQAEVEFDYQRSGLWTTYLGEQIGTTATGSITRDPSNGTTSYSNALSGGSRTLADMLIDFHTANLLNDAGFDARFAYQNPTLAGVRVTVPALADGRTVTETQEAVEEVRGGTAHYAAWTNVTDFQLNLALTAADGTAAARSRSRLRALAETDAGIEVFDLDPAEEAYFFPGAYDRLTLLVAHVEPVSSSFTGTTTDIVTATYSASWGGGQAFEETIAAYDDGVVASLDGGGRWFVGTNGFGTRFDVPAGARLGEVLIPVYYDNQFGGGPADTEPRDFNLAVHAVDATGLPGATLYEQYVEDPRANQDVFTSETNVRLLAVDLFDATANLTLPEAVYLIVTNAGTDDNVIVFAGAEFEAGVPVEDQSAFLLTGGWANLWDISFGTGLTMQGLVIPMRAQFLTPLGSVAVEDEGTLPGRLALEQNYPNPFNPTTTLRYRLDAPGEVRLAVYDVLGREVTTLIQGPQPAGTHEVALDATGWASGLYVYTLEAGGQRLSHTMMLMK